MTLALKSALGGVFIGLVLWLSQTRLSFLAGLLLFFPVISVPTFFFLGRDDGARMRETIVWSFWAIPVWILFALTLYFCSYRWKILPSVGLSLAAWLAGAALVAYLRLGGLP